jgi:hypothetical protein
MLSVYIIVSIPRASHLQGERNCQAKMMRMVRLS